MKFKQKAGYMFIGCLFTIAGYILASLGGITTNAQDEKTSVFERIVCNELLVVKKTGPPCAHIGAAENGGVIEVYTKDGSVAAYIGVVEDGGSIEIYHKAVRPFDSIGASIRASEDGGSIKVYNKAAKEVASIVTDEDDNGVIQTYKGGWRIH